MAWRHPSRRWRAALVAALLTLGAYAPEAKSDSEEVYEHEVMILRVVDTPDAPPGESELCRWWYLYSRWTTVRISPIVPAGWSSYLGCEAIQLRIYTEPEQ